MMDTASIRKSRPEADGRKGRITMPKKELKPELSLKEKERRWSLLRERLKEAGLSALIVYGGSQLGVPLMYLTRIWGNKLNMVIFPVEGEPILLVPPAIWV